MLLLDAESKRFTTTTSRKKHSLFSAKVRIIFELDDNNRKEIFAQTLKLIRINYKKLPYSEFLYKKKVLNNIKIEPLNPSNSHIVHKMTLIMPSQCMCT